MSQYNYTIIIPHYNIPKLLRRLLRTIPKREDVQVIVVDDCSPAIALAEIESYKPEFANVEWYSTGTNGGGGKARNIGLQHAKGKYLIFADADDYFNLCFEDMLDKYKDTAYDEIIFACNSVDSDTFQNTNRGNCYATIKKRYQRSSGNIESIKYQATSPWCKFIFRELVEKESIRFQESRVYNDVRFSQYVDYCSNKMTIDDTAIYCITDCQTSVTKNNSEANTLTRLEIMMRFYHFFIEKDLKPARSVGACVCFELGTVRRFGDKQLLKTAYKICAHYGATKNQILLSIFKLRLKERCSHIINGLQIIKKGLFCRSI